MVESTPSFRRKRAGGGKPDDFHPSTKASRTLNQTFHRLLRPVFRVAGRGSAAGGLPRIYIGLFLAICVGLFSASGAGSKVTVVHHDAHDGTDRMEWFGSIHSSVHEDDHGSHHDDHEDSDHHHHLVSTPGVAMLPSQPGDEPSGYEIVRTFPAFSGGPCPSGPVDEMIKPPRLS